MENIAIILGAIAKSMEVFIGAFIALFTIWIHRFWQKKDKRSEEYDAFKFYSKPLIKSCQSLAYRLKEILQYNGNYLLPNAPESGFFKYKFDSTVYRLCAVIGWIRALEIEHSYIESFEDEKTAAIQHSINKFKTALADGGHIEVSIIEDLSLLFDLGINLTSISQQEKAILGARIEVVMFSHVENRVPQVIKNLSEVNRMQILKEVLNEICDSSNQARVPESKMKSKLDDAISLLTREYCWIYRDWQNAIGDQMIFREKFGNREYSILGFADFDKISKENKWIEKTRNLFSNLDVRVETKFDDRVRQLKAIYLANFEIIEALNNSIVNQEAIPDKSMKELKRFYKEIG